MALTTVQSGILGDSTQTYGMKNRIINGDMRIAQRGTTARAIDNGDWYYPVDRFSAYQSIASTKFSIQQNYNSVTPPVGFKNYVGAYTTTAYTPTGGDWFPMRHTIEGYNAADLDFGTANAKSVTASFWVRSSIAGTHGGAFYNNDGSRSYPYTYTISSANTWEYKTITIPGDTSGTWNITNGGGLTMAFSMGAGPTVSGTAGSWASAFYSSATGAVSPVATSGATLFITGLQIEKGSTATQFDYRSFGAELQLCQRYFCKTFPYATAPAQNIDTAGSIGFISYAANLYDAMWRFPVEMRTAPSAVTTYSPNAANANWSNNGGTPTATLPHSGSTGITIRANQPAGAGYSYTIHASATAEL